MLILCTVRVPTSKSTATSHGCKACSATNRYVPPVYRRVAIRLTGKGSTPGGKGGGLPRYVGLLTALRTKQTPRHCRGRTGFPIPPRHGSRPLRTRAPRVPVGRARPASRGGGA